MHQAIDARVRQLAAKQNQPKCGIHTNAASDRLSGSLGFRCAAAPLPESLVAWAMSPEE